MAPPLVRPMAGTHPPALPKPDRPVGDVAARPPSEEKPSVRGPGPEADAIHLTAKDLPWVTYEPDTGLYYDTITGSYLTEGQLRIVQERVRSQPQHPQVRRFQARVRAARLQQPAANRTDSGAQLIAPALNDPAHDARPLRAPTEQLVEHLAAQIGGVEQAIARQDYASAKARFDVLTHDYNTLIAGNPHVTADPGMARVVARMEVLKSRVLTGLATEAEHPAERTRLLEASDASLQRARAALDAHLARQPDDRAALEQRAAICDAQGDYTAAVGDLQAAAHLDGSGRSAIQDYLATLQLRRAALAQHRAAAIAQGDTYTMVLCLKEEIAMAKAVRDVATVAALGPLLAAATPDFDRAVLLDTIDQQLGTLADVQLRTDRTEAFGSGLMNLRAEILAAHEPERLASLQQRYAQLVQLFQQWDSMAATLAVHPELLHRIATHGGVTTQFAWNGDVPHGGARLVTLFETMRGALASGAAEQVAGALRAGTALMKDLELMHRAERTRQLLLSLSSPVVTSGAIPMQVEYSAEEGRTYGEMYYGATATLNPRQLNWAVLARTYQRLATSRDPAHQALAGRLKEAVEFFRTRQDAPLMQLPGYLDRVRLQQTIERHLAIVREALPHFTVATRSPGALDALRDLDRTIAQLGNADAADVDPRRIADSLRADAGRTIDALGDMSKELQYGGTYMAIVAGIAAQGLRGDAWESRHPDRYQALRDLRGVIVRQQKALDGVRGDLSKIDSGEITGARAREILLRVARALRAARQSLLAYGVAQRVLKRAEHGAIIGYHREAIPRLGEEAALIHTDHVPETTDPAQARTTAIANLRHNVAAFRAALIQMRTELREGGTGWNWGAGNYHLSTTAVDTLIDETDRLLHGGSLPAGESIPGLDGKSVSDPDLARMADRFAHLLDCQGNTTLRRRLEEMHFYNGLRDFTYEALLTAPLGVVGAVAGRALAVARFGRLLNHGSKLVRFAGQAAVLALESAGMTAFTLPVESFLGHDLPPGFWNRVGHLSERVLTGMGMLGAFHVGLGKIGPLIQQKVQQQAVASLLRKGYSPAALIGPAGERLIAKELRFHFKAAMTSLGLTTATNFAAFSVWEWIEANLQLARQGEFAPGEALSATMSGSAMLKRLGMIPAFHLYGALMSPLAKRTALRQLRGALQANPKLAADYARLTQSTEQAVRAFEAYRDAVEGGKTHDPVRFTAVQEGLRSALTARSQFLERLPAPLKSVLGDGARDRRTLADADRAATAFEQVKRVLGERNVYGIVEYWAGQFLFPEAQRAAVIKALRASGATVREGAGGTLVVNDALYLAPARERAPASAIKPETAQAPVSAGGTAIAVAGTLLKGGALAVGAIAVDAIISHLTGGESPTGGVMAMMVGGMKNYAGGAFDFLRGGGHHNRLISDTANWVVAELHKQGIDGLDVKAVQRRLHDELPNHKDNAGFRRNGTAPVDAVHEIARNIVAEAIAARSARAATRPVATTGRRLPEHSGQTSVDAIITSTVEATVQHPKTARMVAAFTPAQRTRLDAVLSNRMTKETQRLLKEYPEFASTPVAEWPSWFVHLVQGRLQTIGRETMREVQLDPLPLPAAEPDLRGTFAAAPDLRNRKLDTDLSSGRFQDKSGTPILLDYFLRNPAELLDRTPAAGEEVLLIYAVDRSGEIRVGLPESFVVHHSSLFGPTIPVIGAGEITVVFHADSRGRIKGALSTLNAVSGHFQPSPETALPIVVGALNLYQVPLAPDFVVDPSVR